MHYIHITRIGNYDKQELVEIFSQFGTITQLYHNPEKGYANIYYTSQEEVDAVIEESRSQPWSAFIGNKSGIPAYNKIQNQNQNNHLETRSVSESGNSEDMDDLSGATRSNEYVDVHGNKLRVWKLRSGEILVPLSEIRHSGFAVFRKDIFDPLLAENDQILEQFYNHILAEARSFLLRNKISFVDENKISEAVERAKSKLFKDDASKGSPQTNSKPYSNNIRSRQSTGTVLRTQPDHNRSNNSDYNRPNNNDYSRQHNNDYSRPQNNDYSRPRKDYTRSHNDNSYFNRNEVNNSKNFPTSTDRIPNQVNRPFNNRSRSRLSNDFAHDRTLQAKDDGNLSITCVSSSTPLLSKAKSFVNVEVERRKENIPPPSVKQEKPILETNCAKEEPKSELRKPDLAPEKVLELDKKSKEVNALKRIALQPDFQTVNVTYVENPSTCWVCLKANMEMMENLLLDIAEFAESSSSKKVDPVVGELFIAEFEGLWYRAQVLETNPLNVIFVDYGNTSNVVCVKSISKPFSDIRAQAVRVQFTDLGSTILKADEAHCIKPIEKVNEETYLVTFKEKQEVKVNETNKQPEVVEKKVEPATVPTKEPVFFDKPDIVHPLKNNDVVMIIGEEKGKLYLRSKDYYIKLKQIVSEIQQLKASPLEEVKLRQIVLVKRADELHRAVVTNVSSKNNVEYIDYPICEEVALSNIYNISESLAKQPATMTLSPKLKGIEQFDAKTIQEINNFMEKKTKFVVELGDTFDLKLNGESLAEKLSPPKPKESVTKETKKSSSVLKYDELEFYTPEIGKDTYMFFSPRGAADLTLMTVNDPRLENWLKALTEMTDDGSASYDPEPFEVCVGLYEDSWYRCAVQAKQDGVVDVLFIDYGNTETLTPKELRRLPEEVRNIPALGINCYLDGVPHDNDKIDDVIRSVILDGQIYEVEIIEQSDFNFKIKLPYVEKKLKELCLI